MTTAAWHSPGGKTMVKSQQQSQPPYPHDTISTVSQGNPPSPCTP